MDYKAWDQNALISMLVVGLVAGYLASWLVGSGKWGLIGALVAGLIGSFVGGPLLGAAGIKLGIKNEMAAKIATSTIGAVVVVILARIIG